ncbi:MAG: EAL domain-containing protein [Phycisphaerales bacterium]
MNPDQRDTVLAKLRHLCESENVTPVFQPIVSLQSAEIVAFEALARPGKDSGFANPSELFETAEQLGMLWDVEAVTRRKALEAAADFPEGTVLFFNSTPAVLADERFIPDLERAVREIGITRARLVLEITERSDDALGRPLIEQTMKLKAMGYTLVLRPQWLKLDRELIEGIDRDRYKINLIKFFIHFARLSGVKVIAEGIETQEELGTLISLGVDHGQGFYLGKPQAQYQLLSAETASLLRSRWIDSVVTPGGVERAATLGSLVQPAKVVQAGTLLLELANDLLCEERCSGVVVVDGRRFVGWAARESILRLAASSAPEQNVGFAVLPGLATLPPTASIGEGLDLAAVREDAEFMAPIVISENEKILGVVPMRSLIAAASSQARSGWGRARGMDCDLPGRVPAEIRARDLIRDAKGHPASAAANTDGAIIDLRGFADYNGALGYELGDRLIQDLTELLLTYVQRPPPYGFLASLGGDRFFATGKSGELEGALKSLMRSYEARPPADENAVPGGAVTLPGLRVLLMPRVFTRIAAPQDVFRIEKQLRQRGRDGGAEPKPGESLFLIDQRLDAAAGAQRLAG